MADKRTISFSSAVLKRIVQTYYQNKLILTISKLKLMPSYRYFNVNFLIPVFLVWDTNVTNEEVRRKIQAAIGEYDELLTLVKKRKLR